MPKRTQEQLDARREQIMRAAIACIARTGFHKTTMRDICAEAELSAGAVYNYFSSKEEILAAAVESRRSVQRTALAEISGRASAQQALLAYFGFLFDSFQSDSFRRLGSVDADVLAESTRNEQVKEIVEEEYHSLVITLTQILFKGQQSGQMSDDFDPAVMARTIIALSLGIKLHLLVYGEDEVVGFRRTIQQLIFGTLWKRPETGDKG